MIGDIIVPNFSIGDEYADRMLRVTEAPRSFHYACLLTVCGALLGRKVWIPYGHKLYPNLFTCLIGASGLTRKTTSIRLAANIVAPDKLNIMRGLSSFEGLLMKLKDTPEVLVILEEFSSFLLKVKKQDAVSSMLPKLAELFDTPERVELPTKQDPIVVTRPFVSVATATTPEWLETSLEFADVMGGIGSRFMFIFGEVDRSVPLPGLVDYGKIPDRIWNMSQRFKDDTRLVLDTDAEELWFNSYDKWYEQQKTQDEVRRVLDIRMPTMVLKVAMIIHCMEGVGKTISYTHLEAALDYIESVRGYLDELRPILSPLEFKVLKIVKDEGSITRSGIHRRLSGRVKSTDLYNSIAVLMKFKRLEEQEGTLKVCEG